MSLLVDASRYIEEQGGDHARGAGYVVVSRGDAEEYLRIEFTRNSDRKWMVSAVTKAQPPASPEDP